MSTTRSAEVPAAVDPGSQAAAARKRSPWWGRLGAFVAGGLPVFAFPPPGLWWWAFVALVPATLLIARAPTRRVGIVRSWWAAAGYAVAASYWTAPNVGPGLALFAFGLALLYLVWGWLAWELLHPPSTPWRSGVAFALLPSAWLAAEFARSWSALGGPWGVLGASQWNDRAFLAMASVGGVWLVSLALVAVNTGLAAAASPGTSARTRVLVLSLSALVVAAGFAFGSIRGDPRPDGYLTVAVVQPGPGLDRVDRFDAQVAETAAVAARHPRLVVWGETSVSFDLLQRRGWLERLEGLSARMGADILVNEDAADPHSGSIHKRAELIGARGIISSYEKMRLVPFGEYIPLRSALGWLTDISRAAKVNRERGRSLVVMQPGHGVPPIGALICFEETFPDMSRKLAGLDAQLIVYQTSDSTFQQSWEPAQHASLAAVRAVESGRPTIHAALTGISAAFDAGGRRLAWEPSTRRGAFVVSVPLSYSTDFFLRWGQWAPDGALALLLLSGICALGKIALRHHHIAR